MAKKTAKKQFLKSGLRKLQHRSTQDFMCKDIHLKGTFTEILKEIHQTVFEKKLKKHLKRKVIHELCVSHHEQLLHFWARNPLSSVLIYTKTKARESCNQCTT